MSLIDTHAHVYLPKFAEERTQIMARSRAQDVQAVYMPNISLETLAPMLEVSQQYPDVCFPMLGLHPCEVKQDFRQQLAELEAQFDHGPFVGIGEIGLDFHWEATYQAEQEAAFEAQLAWARQRDLPVVLHCRKAFNVMLKILKKHARSRPLRGIFHCFGGTLAVAEEIIALGLHLGIGGIVTFKNAGLDKVVAELDMSHLVLETDSPYLAPVPHRGQRNEPAYVRLVAEKIAAIKQLPIAAVARITTENALQVFQ